MESRIVPNHSKYKVNEYGDVIRIAGRLPEYKLKPSNNNGYIVYRYMQNDDGKASHSLCAHQLVAWAFIGLCPEGYEVDHIDNDRNNNHYSNLQYVTHKTNMQLARKRHPWDSYANYKNSTQLLVEFAQHIIHS